MGLEDIYVVLAGASGIKQESGRGKQGCASCDSQRGKDQEEFHTCKIVQVCSTESVEDMSEDLDTYGCVWFFFLTNPEEQTRRPTKRSPALEPGHEMCFEDGLGSWSRWARLQC